MKNVASADRLFFYNIKLWLEVTIVTSFDVLTANNNDENLVETRTIHFAWLLNRLLVLIEYKNLTANTRLGKFYHLYGP